MTRRVVFVRHGRTLDNAAGVFQGQSGRGLDAVGRAQAARLAERMRGRRFGAFVSSDLARAAETAAAVGEAIAMEPAIDPAFREIDVGGWSGLTAEEARAQYPEEHAAWRRGEDVRRGGGESYSEVAVRIERATIDLVARPAEGDVLIVSHGTAIRAFAARVVGAPAQAARGWPVMLNTGLTTFTWDGTIFRLVTWNDVVHLEGMADGD